MLSTESSNASTRLLPALSDWVHSSPGDLTISGVKLTPYKICISPDMPCHTTSGLSPGSDSAYSEGEFAAVLVVLFIALIGIAVLVLAMVIVCWKGLGWKDISQKCVLFIAG